MNIAIIGATGQVGQTLLKLLAEQKFPAAELSLVASARSAGKNFSYLDAVLTVQDLTQFDFSKVACAFFAAGSEVAKHYAPIAVNAGCVVIDKSAYFRLQSDVPLIVPEVNGELLDLKHHKIYAVPNCTTIPLVMALKPIQALAGIERVEVATYQAVSGAGVKGIKALETEIATSFPRTRESILSKVNMDSRVRGNDGFTIPIAFNVIPKIDEVLPSGFTKEEIKMQEESQKILAENFIVNATAVRVPVWQGHSEAVHVKTLRPLKLAELAEAFQAFPGIKYCEEEIPTPATHAANNPWVWIARLRRHPQDDACHFNFWLTCDNLYKGAAWNALQIAQKLGFLG